MSDTITVTGVIATEPKHVVTREDLRITSFRLASQQRRYDRAQAKWVDAETNWFTVTAFRGLAENAEASLRKGERVLVHGRLRVRGWTSGEKSGITIEIEADAIGHDLAWGKSEFQRVPRGAGQDAEPTEPADGSEPAEGRESAEAPDYGAESELVGEPVGATPF